MKKIIKDEEIYEIVTTSFPYFIAHEYKRFYDLLEEGRYIGAFFEMKDVLEVLLKFPALVGTACAVKMHEQDESIRDCLPALLRKQMSLGDWQVYAGDIRRILDKDETMAPVADILKDIKKHYDRQHIVKWRNTMIGHGAVANDMAQYMADFEKYSGIINTHLKSCMKAYRALKILVGDDVLQGDSPLLKPENVSGVVSASVNGCAFQISPFIFTRGEYIYFFDSMNRWHLVVDGLDYVSGRKIMFQSDYFLKKYREYESKSGMQPDLQKIGRVVTTEQNNFLNELNASRNFVPMDNLYQWCLDCLNGYDSGVFLLQMERAMGKTAFVSSLDQLIQGDNGDEELEDTVIRCYYCSRMEYRSTSDFINTCNTALFNKNKNADYNIEASDYTWRHLTLDGHDPAGQMCQYLEDFRDIYRENFGKSKICLFIDGLDEITPDNMLASGCSILDYIPDSSQIPESVYIFLTCRTGEDEPLSDLVSEWLDQYQPANVKLVGRGEGEHRQNLEYFLEEHLTPEECLEETDKAALIEKAKGSYTQLQLLIGLIQMGMDIKEVLAFDDVSVLNRFLSHVVSGYNDKMFQYTKDILAIIAAAYEPLTLEQIAYLLGYSSIPMDMLVVLKNIHHILDFMRTPEGTKIRLANEVFRSQLCGQYKECISRQVEGWIDMLEMTGKMQIDEVNGTDIAYIYNEGAVYLYANILNYAERTGEPDILAKIYTKEMAGIIYQFETHLDAKNHGYRGVLKDMEMSGAVIKILEKCMARGEDIDGLVYAKAYNNRGFHRGFTLTDYLGGEADYTRACEILDGLNRQDKDVLVVMGRIMNGMASVKLRCGRSFDEVQRWRTRSIEARRKMMDIDFARSVEEYMASLLENAQALMQHGRYDMICSYYEEMGQLCERIVKEYPDSYEKGMLYPRGKNRVEYGYVCQMAKMRVQYAGCLLKTREIHSIDDMVQELYEQSIEDYERMIRYTGGVQVVVHGLLYKTEYSLGWLHLQMDRREDAIDCWKKAFRIVRILSMDNKLYDSSVLEQFLTDFRFYLQECEPHSDYLVQISKLRIQG